MWAKFFSVLLTRLYYACAIGWFILLAICVLQDGPWPTDVFRTLGYWTLGVIGIAFIHWVILYRKELKDDADQKSR